MSKPIRKVDISEIDAWRGLSIHSFADPTQNNQTKNTKEQVYNILEQFGFDFSPVAVLPQRRKFITNRQIDAMSSAVDQIEALLSQTKQETIQACKEALPSKEDRFNDMDICFCGTVIGVDGSDFPRRVSHQDCPAIKAIDTAHKALNKLGDK
jgi:hypothetical protein